MPPAARTCPRCGTAFTCGLLAGHSRCWCAELPAIVPPAAMGLEPAANCLCPACLASEAARQMDASPMGATDFARQTDAAHNQETP